MVAVAQNCSGRTSPIARRWNELNVYFDGELLPSNKNNGWTLKGDTVTLHGDACDQLEAGDVDEVQLLSGCQTIVR